MKPHCRFCHTTRRKLFVQSWHTGRKHQYYSCNPCNTSRIRAYRKTISGKEAIKRATKRYEEKNREKRVAWRAVNQAGLKGRRCVSCGHTGLVHLHHPDYSKPLEVVPLCPKCHKDEHKSLSTG